VKAGRLTVCDSQRAEKGTLEASSRWALRLAQSTKLPCCSSQPLKGCLLFDLALARNCCTPRISPALFQDQNWQRVFFLLGLVNPVVDIDRIPNDSAVGCKHPRSSEVSSQGGQIGSTVQGRRSNGRRGMTTKRGVSSEVTGRVGPGL